MRINPTNNLAGPYQITPQSSPVDTFAEVRTQRLVPQEIIDLTGLSSVLARYVGDQEAQARQITAQEMEAIGRRTEAGESLDEILKEYSDSGLTPARVRSQLAKAFNEAGLAPAANPLYVQSFRKGQADIKSVALRKALMAPDQIEDIVKASEGLNGEKAFAAMLSAVQQKIAAAKPYDGLEGLGSAAMNEQLLGITRSVMDAADVRYNQKLQEKVRDGIGAQVLLSIEEFTGTDNTEVRDAAVQKMVLAMTSARIGGEPRAKEFFADAVLAVATEIGQADPAGAAEFLAEVIEAKEGEAEVFGSDVETRARMAVLAGQLRRRATEDLQYQDIRDKEREKEVERELSSSYISDIVAAQRIGPEAVQALFHKISGEAVASYTDDKDRQYALDWLRREASVASQTSRTIGSSIRTTQSLWESVYFEAPDVAMDRLMVARRDGLVAPDDFLKIHESLVNRKENVWVFEKPEVIRFAENFRDEILASEIFLEERTGRQNMAEVAAAQLRVSDDFNRDLEAFMASPEFAEEASVGVKEKLLNKWIATTRTDYLRRIVPEGTKEIIQRDLTGTAEAVKTTRKLEVLDDRAATTPPDIGGFGEKAPKILKQLNQDVLERPGMYKPTVGLRAALEQVDFLDTRKSLDVGVKRRKFFKFARNLEDIASDPDLKDGLGNPLSQRQRDQIIAESLAYGGAFDLDELISGTAKPKTIENWGGGPPEEREGGAVFPGIEKSLLLSPSLRLDDLDITRVPIPEVARLGLAVTRGEDGQVQGIKVTPENREGIDKVRALLRSYNLDDSDRNVGLFIRHQYNITR